MNDRALLEFGRAAAYMCTSYANLVQPPRKPFVLCCSSRRPAGRVAPAARVRIISRGVEAPYGSLEVRILTATGSVANGGGVAQKDLRIDNGFLRGDAKQGVNEGTLTEYIAFGQPAHLSFADHVHRLVPINRVQRAPQRSKPETRGDALLDEAVILLDHVV
jgi:hypothetical protein